MQRGCRYRRCDQVLSLHTHSGRGPAASASRRAGERSTRQADCRLLASSLTPGLSSSTCVESETGMARPVWPASRGAHLLIGRGWWPP